MSIEAPKEGSMLAKELYKERKDFDIAMSEFNKKNIANPVCHKCAIENFRRARFTKFEDYQTMKFTGRIKEPIVDRRGTVIVHGFETDFECTVSEKHGRAVIYMPDEWERVKHIFVKSNPTLIGTTVDNSQASTTANPIAGSDGADNREG